MGRLALMLVLLGSLFLVRPAAADSNPTSIESITKQAMASVIVPLAWDGVWTTLDTVYTCAGVFQSTSTGTDTICGGKDFTLGTQGSPFNFVCNGSADATSYSMVCTASVNVFTDCAANYTLTAHGTVSGGSFHSVSTLEVAYVGTGFGCNLLQPSCTQTDSWGTRTGPAPSSYCTTPVLHPTWGQLKSAYR